MSSQWLNYHHLLYFWTVAQEGSIGAAGMRLRLAHPTISRQIKTLEDQLGVTLFDRSGRKLALTEVGRIVFRYADNIFSLGSELIDVLQDAPFGRVRLRVGVDQAIPKLIAARLIEPALRESEGLQLVCHEDQLDQLISRLARHELDLVVSDTPLTPGSTIKASNHLLGESGISFFAAPGLAEPLRDEFPRSLDGARLLLPMHGSALRRELDRWLEAESLRPDIVGQFDGDAMLSMFAQLGVGVFAGPSVIEADIERQLHMQVVGRTDFIHECFYAITEDRRIRHPGVVALSRSAKAIFGSTEASKSPSAELGTEPRLVSERAH